MAIFSKYLACAAILFPLAMAMPLIHARVLVTDVVTKTDWVVVDVTTTVYVNDATVTSATMTTTPVADTTTSAVAVPTTSSSAAITTASTPALPTDPPATSTEASATDGQFAAVPTSSTTPVAVPTTATTPTTYVATSAPAATTAAVAGVGGGPTSASDTATCEGEDNACVGDVTYWDGGLGACGTVVDTVNDLAIALPYQFMGTLSNDNPYCGRTVTLFNPTSGTTVQATVLDKCMGCLDRAIDCTEKLFNAITDGTGNGRVHGIEWWLD